MKCDNLLQKYTGECTCNASDILEAIKDNETLRETLRGPPGQQGRDGKTGAPGLTVSSCQYVTKEGCGGMGKWRLIRGGWEVATGWLKGNI